jgi:XRE family transcriptional regulator, regulator of sulfur utilization
MSRLQLRVGQKLRQLRQKRGWSQEEFADISGLHRTYVGSVERGERNLTLNSLQTLAKALKVRMSDILKGMD